MACRPAQSLLTLFDKPTENPAHRSIQRHLVAGMILFGAVGFGVGGWAATTRISGAVITSGYLVVDTNVKKVQHPTGGVIAELDVRDGDRVEEGQILVGLDKTQSLAQLMVVAKSLDELQARQARLEAERDNQKQIAVPNALLFVRTIRPMTRQKRSRANRASLKCAAKRKREKNLSYSREFLNLRKK